MQITVLKQEKVACLADNEARLSLAPGDPFTLETKPHGHGDVHALLHASGTARAWHKAGVKWVCFFQVGCPGLIGGCARGAADQGGPEGCWHMW
jgi:UDP-sugar pyrophosphorylase